eukprot:CAMPEP_0181344254 /NCGR_PEP_ID=MMETSP1101-20121128/32077_1 /TAXON_ID=46948 /ORGANISM="Rhodomonas abbreviata, Strain Caron Lab Isolate" /LENGTH=87 /DNA_ID=CAMNT_0023456049 /DNA_START=1030 /DNA_END=1293 /DNA_ORIENTATION=+
MKLATANTTAVGLAFDTLLARRSCCTSSVTPSNPSLTPPPKPVPSMYKYPVPDAYTASRIIPAASIDIPDRQPQSQLSPTQPTSSAK